MRHRHIVVASALMVTFLTSACTTLRPVPVRAAGVFVSIRPGDHLRVMTRAGGEHRITVATVQPDVLRATDGTQYRFDNVLMIQRREFDRRKNIILGVTTGVLVFLGIALYNGLCVCTQ